MPKFFDNLLDAWEKRGKSDFGKYCVDERRKEKPEREKKSREERLQRSLSPARKRFMKPRSLNAEAKDIEILYRLYELDVLIYWGYIVKQIRAGDSLSFRDGSFESLEHEEYQKLARAGRITDYEYKINMERSEKYRVFEPSRPVRVVDRELSESPREFLKSRIAVFQEEVERQNEDFCNCIDPHFTVYLKPIKSRLIGI